MVKSFKGKVVTGVVAVGLLSGVSMAFANTDAGTKLQQWYNGQFGQSASTIQSGATSYAEGLVQPAIREYNGYKTEATNSINATRDTEISGATSEINSAKDGHITALNNKKAVIQSGMEGQFDAISTFANGLIDQAGTEIFNYAQGDLNRHVSGKGSQALSQVETDLNAAKESAKSELETAISTAKSELQAQLATETSATLEEIKDAIDGKVVELRGLVVAKRDELVNTQKGLIEAKAQELENAAKAELDAVVNGIN